MLSTVEIDQHDSKDLQGGQVLLDMSNQPQDLNPPTSNSEQPPTFHAAKKTSPRGKQSKEDLDAKRHVQQVNRRERIAAAMKPGADPYVPIRPGTTDRKYTTHDDRIIERCYVRYAAQHAGWTLPKEELGEWFNARVGMAHHRSWQGLDTHISRSQQLREMRASYPVLRKAAAGQ